jgi:hypothetical protein
MRLQKGHIHSHLMIRTWICEVADPSQGEENGVHKWRIDSKRPWPLHAPQFNLPTEPTLNDENENVSPTPSSDSTEHLPPRPYPLFSSPAPSDFAASPRRSQTSDVHGPCTALSPTSTTSEDQKPSSYNSKSTQPGSHCLRPWLAVGREPHDWRRRTQLVSGEVARESGVQFGFSGVLSLRGVAGEKMRAEAASD